MGAFHAAEVGDLNALCTFLTTKATAFQKTSADYQRIMQESFLLCCFHGHVHIAQYLLSVDRALCLTAVDHLGFDGLSFAATNNKHHMLTFLLNCNPSWDKTTSILVSLIAGNVESCRILLQQALQGSVTITQLEPIVICFLLQQDTHAMALSELGAEILHTHPLIQYPSEQVRFWIACAQGDLKAMQALSPLAGVDIHAPCPDGRTAVLLACANGHAGALYWLLGRGADTAASDILGRSAWQLAASADDVLALELLCGMERLCPCERHYLSILQSAVAAGAVRVLAWLLVHVQLFRCRHPSITPDQIASFCTEVRRSCLYPALQGLGPLDLALRAGHIGSVLQLLHLGYGTDPAVKAVLWDPSCAQRAWNISPLMMDILYRSQQWSERKHRLFGPVFRSVVRAVLLVYYRMLAASAAGSSASPQCAPCLPWEMWCMILQVLQPCWWQEPRCRLLLHPF